MERKGGVVSMFKAKWIEGKTIDRVDMDTRIAVHGEYRVTMHDPTIVFTDGSYIHFMTEENPMGGEYGTGIIYCKPRRKGVRKSGGKNSSKV